MRKCLLLFVSLMVISSPCYSDELEVVTGLDAQKDLPVLNEILRKNDTSVKAIDTRVDTLESYYAADTASNDTYVISLATAPTAYTTGMIIYFKATTANTGACTVNVNNLGAKSLKSLHDTDPLDNYIEAGSMVQAMYDGTNFQILNPDANP